MSAFSLWQLVVGMGLEMQDLYAESPDPATSNSAAVDCLALESVISPPAYSTSTPLDGWKSAGAEGFIDPIRSL